MGTGTSYPVDPVLTISMLVMISSGSKVSSSSSAGKEDISVKMIVILLYVVSKLRETHLRIDNSWQGMIRATLIYSGAILSTVLYYTSNYR